MNFLLKTKIKEILIENGEDDLEFTYTLYNIAKNLEYELFKKGDIVFRIGDPGDKFYIILQGSVSILKLFETELFCTGEEYIELLSKLKSDNEKYMVKRTIILNKDKINIDFNNIEEVLEKIFKRKLHKYLKFYYSHSEITELFKIYKKLPENYKINLNAMKKYEKDKKNSTAYVNYLNQIIAKNFEETEDEGIISFEQIDERKRFIISRYDQIILLKSGQFFGDFALDTNTNRSATLMAVDDETHLGIIQKDMYYEFILKEKLKMESKKINFIYETFFYKIINKMNFEKKFFKSFTYEEFPKGHILFKENENLKNIYILFLGRINLSAKKNFYMIEKEIKDLSKLDIQVKNNFEESLKNDKKISIREIKLLEQELSKTKEFLIKKVSNKEILGVENLIFKIPYHYKATVSSEKLCCFSIDAKIFLKLIQSEEEAIIKFNDISIKKIISYQTRLKDISKTFIELTKFNNNYNKRLMNESKIINTFSSNFNPHTDKNINIIPQIKESNIQNELIRNKSSEIKLDYNNSPTINENSFYLPDLNKNSNLYKENNKENLSPSPPNFQNNLFKNLFIETENNTDNKINTSTSHYIKKNNTRYLKVNECLNTLNKSQDLEYQLSTINNVVEFPYINEKINFDTNFDESNKITDINSTKLNIRNSKKILSTEYNYTSKNIIDSDRNFSNYDNFEDNKSNRFKNKYSIVQSEFIKSNNFHEDKNILAKFVDTKDFGVSPNSPKNTNNQLNSNLLKINNKKQNLFCFNSVVYKKEDHEEEFIPSKVTNIKYNLETNPNEKFNKYDKFDTLNDLCNKKIEKLKSLNFYNCKNKFQQITKKQNFFSSNFLKNSNSFVENYLNKKCNDSNCILKINVFNQNNNDDSYIFSENFETVTNNINKIHFSEVNIDKNLQRLTKSNSNHVKENVLFKKAVKIDFNLMKIKKQFKENIRKKILDKILPLINSQK